MFVIRTFAAGRWWQMPLAGALAGAHGAPRPCLGRSWAGGASGRAVEAGIGLPQSKDGRRQWLTRRRRKRRVAEETGSVSGTETGPAVFCSPTLVQTSIQVERSEEPSTV